MEHIDWTECALIETVPGKRGGKPVIKGTRLRLEDLLTNREQGIKWLIENHGGITSDKNIRHQNRIGGLRIAVLELGTNHWPTLQRQAETVSVALADLGHGEYRRVALPRPLLVRWPPPERD